jgi:L-arabinose isomerase
MPFLEISQAMSRGTGYAGEGDVITAALVGALASAFSEVTFTEMFCPDWKNNRILLSHMGEANPKLFADAPLLVKSDFPYTDAGSTVIAAGCFKSGEAVMVNLSEQPGGHFKLILSNGHMVEPPGTDNMKGSIRGWFEPDMPLTDYLAAFSRNGGTHHSVLVYGDYSKQITQFGEWMDWEVVVL